MPRTAAKNAKKDEHPEKRYAKLGYIDRLICYLYFQWGETDGAEGWDPEKAGSIYHYRSSQSILSAGSSSWFRHRAKLMVTLAEKFAQANKKPAKPVAPSEEEESYTNRPQARRKVQQQEEKEDEEDYRSPAPKPTKMQRIPKTPKAGLMVYQPDLDVAGTNNLSVPMSYGTHKKWDQATKRSTTRILIRMVLHGGCEDEDFDYEWITPRSLMIRVKWPEWFVNAQEMELFATADDDETPLFGPEHPLTMDICERNYGLVDEHGDIWDEGILKFCQDMDTDNCGIEVVNAAVPGKTEAAKVIQIYVPCAPMDEAPSAGKKTKLKATRSVNVGSAGKRGAKRGDPGDVGMDSEYDQGNY